MSKKKSLIAEINRLNEIATENENVIHELCLSECTLTQENQQLKTTVQHLTRALSSLAGANENE